MYIYIYICTSIVRQAGPPEVRAGRRGRVGSRRESLPGAFHPAPDGRAAGSAGRARSRAKASRSFVFKKCMVFANVLAIKSKQSFLQEVKGCFCLPPASGGWPGHQDYYYYYYHYYYYYCYYCYYYYYYHYWQKPGEPASQPAKGQPSRPHKLKQRYFCYKETLPIDVMRLGQRLKASKQSCRAIGPNQI